MKVLYRPYPPSVGMRRAAIHRRISHVTSLARRRTLCSWTLATHARQSRCDYPHILLRGSMRSSSSKSHPRGFLFHTPAIIVPRRRLPPLARAHLLSPVRLLRHRLHQKSNQQAALPPEAHAFIGTRGVPMVASRYC